MPTYEYQCPCGEQFEVFQSITAEPGADCPDCGEGARRLISGGAGLIFKGSGFYETDYKNKGANSRPKDPNKKADTEPKKETSSSESKASDSKSTDSSKSSDNKTPSGAKS